MFRDAFGVCVAEFDNLKLYRQFVFEASVAAFRVVQGEIPKQPLRMRNVDKSADESFHPVIPIDVRVRVR